MKITFNHIALGLVSTLIVTSIGMSIANSWQTQDPSCLPGDDKCVEDAIKQARASRDSQYAIIDENIAKWTSSRKDVENSSNERINTYKTLYSTGYTLTKIKEGKFEDVAPDLLSFKQTRDGSTGGNTERSSLKELLIPSAFADSSTGTTDQTTELYQKIKVYLNKKNAPFKDIDLEMLARGVGISDYQVLVLLGIIGHESDFGNAFARTEGNRVIAASIEQGREYHNYSGLKACRKVDDCPEPTPIPDADGFWLQKYDSDQQFLRTYFTQMKRGYFDKACETPACVRFWYVGGSATKKVQWANQVGTIMQQILNTELPN